MWMRNLLLPMLLLCWPTSSVSIINGFPADVSDFRSFVSIRVISPFPSHGGKEINGCCGALVAPDWVLSALHCKPMFEGIAAGYPSVFAGFAAASHGMIRSRITVRNRLSAITSAMVSARKAAASGAGVEVSRVPAVIAAAETGIGWGMKRRPSTKAASAARHGNARDTKNKSAAQMVIAWRLGIT